ncbi:hypothetical protein, partial [Pseudomonas tolaasii]|uniref:hypothetical protein n=1 Tax=Pseudomonas tolaasii TaxID=29442 RepID=UPI001E48EF73
CVGMPPGTLCVPMLGDAERHGMHSHSWLACDGGVSVTAAIAGKPAPTLTAFTQQGCVLSEFDYE